MARPGHALGSKVFVGVLALLPFPVQALTTASTPPSLAVTPLPNPNEHYQPLPLPPIPPPPPPHTSRNPPPTPKPLPPDPPDPPSLARDAAIRRARAHEREEAWAHQPPPAPTAPLVMEAPTPMTAPPEKVEASGPPPLHGELVEVGMIRLVNPYNYASLALGPTVIKSSLYATADPQFAFYGNNWSIAAHVPLNLDVINLNGTHVSYGGLHIRREDWQKPSDYLRVIRFATFGHSEDPIYIAISSLQPLSLGHHMLLDRYQGNLDVSSNNTSAMVDLSNRFAGLQALMNDITFTNRLVGGLAFVKPLFWLDVLPLRSLSLGGEYVADLRAPRCVRYGPHSSQCVQGTGNVGGINPRTSQPYSNTFVNSDPQTGLYDVTTTTVHAAGFSGETKVYQDSAVNDIKVYSTWHTFLNSGGGTGFALGSLARFQTGEKWLNAFRVRAEYRTFTDGFLPSYFDTTYEADKYEYGYNHQVYQVIPTKYQAVFGDPSNGFARQNLGRRHGLKLDFQWALYRGSRAAKRLAIGVGFEDSTGPNDAGFYAHVEAPAFHALQLFGTYLHRNESSLAGLFSRSTFHSANTVLLAGLRLRILPILWLAVQYSYTFQLAQSPGTEYQMGNSNIPASPGLVPAPQVHLFVPASLLAAQLEFGWDFGD